MSSARKRAAIQKANTETERLRQKLAVAETMGNVWKAAAEYAASKHDELVALCRQLHKAEETKNQQDWTAVIRSLEKVGADSTAAMGSNAKSQATDAALSRQVACTDGLGVAVPSAPTFGKD